MPAFASVLASLHPHLIVGGKLSGGQDHGALCRWYDAPAQVGRAEAQWDCCVYERIADHVQQGTQAQEETHTDARPWALILKQ